MWKILATRGPFGKNLLPTFFPPVPQPRPGLPCSASPSLYSVPLTFTSWMVTTVIMNRYEGWGGPPTWGVLPSEHCSPVSTLILQCLHALSPMGHRAVAMEAAVKPGTGSAKPFGAMVSPAGYGEQKFGGKPRIDSWAGIASG